MGKVKAFEFEEQRRRVERVVRLLAERDPESLERWLQQAEDRLARTSARSRRS